VGDQEFPPLLFIALNCTHLPDKDVLRLARFQGVSVTATRGLTDDVILDALERARERWPRDRVFEDFSNYLIGNAVPSQLRAAVSAAISGGYQDLTHLFIRHGKWSDLSSADLLALLHELLDHGCGKSITGMDYRPDPFKQISVSDMLAVLQRLASSPAPTRPCRFGGLPPQAAHFAKEEVLELAEAAISHGHHGFADALLAPPVLQSLGKEKLYSLLETAARFDSWVVVSKLARLPVFQQVDVTLLLNLLKLLKQKPPAPAPKLSGFTRLIANLYHLPALYGQLLKAAMQSGEASIFSAMTIDHPWPGPSFSRVLQDEDLQGLLKQAVADGHELTACNLVRLPQAGRLPRGLLQQLHTTAVEKGQVVVQRGLDYLLHLQQLEASIKS
jgi:hypothetical protein